MSNGMHKIIQEEIDALEWVFEKRTKNREIWGPKDVDLRVPLPVSKKMSTTSISNTLALIKRTERRADAIRQRKAEEAQPEAPLFEYLMPYKAITIAERLNMDPSSAATAATQNYRLAGKYRVIRFDSTPALRQQGNFERVQYVYFIFPFDEQEEYESRIKAQIAQWEAEYLAQEEGGEDMDVMSAAHAVSAAVVDTEEFEGMSDAEVAEQLLEEAVENHRRREKALRAEINKLDRELKAARSRLGGTKSQKVQLEERHEEILEQNELLAEELQKANASIADLQQKLDATRKRAEGYQKAIELVQQGRQEEVAPVSNEMLQECLSIRDQATVDWDNQVATIDLRQWLSFLNSLLDLHTRGS